MIRVNANIRDNYLIISVEDQGLGISEKELKNLFAIDSHFRKPGTNNEQGSGLGLILCKEFVEKNQGEIWAEGEEKKGCKFSFSLPLFSKKDGAK